MTWSAAVQLSCLMSSSGDVLVGVEAEAAVGAPGGLDEAELFVVAHGSQGEADPVGDVADLVDAVPGLPDSFATLTSGS